MKGYQTKNTIGSGAYGTVYRAEKNKKDFALKVFNAPLEHQRVMESVMNELNYATKVQDTDAVIAPIEAFVSESDNGSEKQICITYELAENGALFNHI